MHIPFNKPFTIENEFTYMQDAINRGVLRGDGYYTHRVHELMEKKLGCKKFLLVHSGTAALEMAALLCDIQPGDEIIMPSYTFVSTANAFVLRGGVPVFIDIREDTLNIDEKLIEAAITPKTKAICCVHYAGVSCELDAIMDIAKRHNLYVIEDAAQGVGSSYKGRQLGTIGDIGCYSFHETKNIISGEGGGLVINNAAFLERAEIIREKGTAQSSSAARSTNTRGLTSVRPTSRRTWSPRSFVLRSRTWIRSTISAWKFGRNTMRSVSSSTVKFADPLFRPIVSIMPICTICFSRRLRSGRNSSVS